ncbi:MAG: hypothetical protein IT293_02985 [Deltaproteobacteria bacterium]|nr:hypothetical protein [Deltaproteobacteria bacterium]
MLKIGDVVVTMSYPGIFTVVETHGDAVTISDGGSRILKVQASNVRRVKRDAPTAS